MGGSRGGASVLGGSHQQDNTEHSHQRPQRGFGIVSGLRDAVRGGDGSVVGAVSGKGQGHHDDAAPTHEAEHARTATLESRETEMYRVSEAEVGAEARESTAYASQWEEERPAEGTRG